MAVDTANKRASCLGIASPFPRVYAIPDAALSVNDRMQVAYCYAGINPALSSGSIVCDTGAFFVVGQSVNLTPNATPLVLFPVDPQATYLTREFERKVQTLLNSLQRARQFALSDVNTWTIQITSDMIAAAGALSNGQYTPQIAAVSNLALYAVFPANYSRVGSIVTVSGTVQVTPTAIGQAYIEITLPLPTTFSATYNLAGSGNSAEATAHGAAIYANVTTNVATIIWRAPDTNARTIAFVFSYRLA